MPPPERIGVDAAETAAAVEEAGFTSLWVGGGNPDPAAFARLRAQLAGGGRLVVATGIASVWAWRPGGLRAAAGDLAAAFPGRFILGLGVSHAPAVEALGHVYARPLAKMEKFPDELGHPACHGGERALPPIVLAALGPKMLELARDQGDLDRVIQVNAPPTETGEGRCSAPYQSRQKGKVRRSTQGVEHMLHSFHAGYSVAHGGGGGLLA
jgi:alkanesulfonate monooxygenase SsuD/methylene tetrahydromethanopterin reductase-like flavin-dependent oxidoreductase (luciferase family)